MTRVLLVTGARSLADDPAAEAWARGKIAEALVGTDLLIVGDALRDPSDIAIIGRVAEAIRALPLDAPGGAT